MRRKPGEGILGNRKATVEQKSNLWCLRGGKLIVGFIDGTVYHSRPGLD